MKRKLFCEINSFTYAISVRKMRFIRHLANWLAKDEFAKIKGEELPVVMYKHKSLIRRRLGDVDMQLQENKATNLAIAAPKISGIFIRPGEVFSFWSLAAIVRSARATKKVWLYLPANPRRGLAAGCANLPI